MSSAVDSGWREAWNEKRQRKYYYNKKTKETTWRKPDGYIKKMKKRSRSDADKSESKAAGQGESSGLSESSSKKRARKDNSKNDRADVGGADGGGSSRSKSKADERKAKPAKASETLDAKQFKDKVRRLVSQTAKKLHQAGQFANEAEMRSVSEITARKVEQSEAQRRKQAGTPTVWTKRKGEKIEAYIREVIFRQVELLAKKEEAEEARAAAEGSSVPEWMEKRRQTNPGVMALF
eukprot:g591.t1